MTGQITLLKGRPTLSLSFLGALVDYEHRRQRRYMATHVNTWYAVENVDVEHKMGMVVILQQTSFRWRIDFL